MGRAQSKTPPALPYTSAPWTTPGAYPYPIENGSQRMAGWALDPEHCDIAHRGAACGSRQGLPGRLFYDDAGRLVEVHETGCALWLDDDLEPPTRALVRADSERTLTRRVDLPFGYALGPREHGPDVAATFLRLSPHEGRARLLWDHSLLTARGSWGAAITAQGRCERGRGDDHAARCYLERVVAKELEHVTPFSRWASQRMAHARFERYPQGTLVAHWALVGSGAEVMLGMWTLAAQSAMRQAEIYVNGTWAGSFGLFDPSRAGACPVCAEEPCPHRLMLAWAEREPLHTSTERP